MCISFLFAAAKHPSGNVSQPEGPSIHPEEMDSGVIACVIIAITIISVLILGTVSDIVNSYMCEAEYM